MTRRLHWIVLSLALALGLSAPAFAQDADSDSIADAEDNCVNVANAGQEDRNYDGYGDRCDPDYWNDGAVNDIDYEIFLECFTLGTPDCDLNGDGDTTASDFTVFYNVYNGSGTPGPSGLACAGTIPCADASVVGDTDSDGVADSIDNCVNESNASQVDVNGDGLGNHCDPDYDQDGNVDDVDYEIFLECFGTGSGDCDLNGDSTTTASDFGVFNAFHPGPPGTAGPGAQDSSACTIAKGNCP